MKRPALAAGAIVLGLGLGLASTQPAIAATSFDTEVTDVRTSWSNGQVSVRFDWDVYAFARVDVLVDGATAGTMTLPEYDTGTSTVEFDRLEAEGATPIGVQLTSCDYGTPDDSWATCETVGVHNGTLLPTKAVPGGEANASTLLEDLSVRRESHTGSYERERFHTWNDANKDGEDARAEVLKAESKKKTAVNGSGTVNSGRWVSAYDGRTLTRPTQVEVDHVVALAEAWRSGAWDWSEKRREAFGNDLGFGPSLIAVSKASNRAKSDDDPASWLPSTSRAACVYARNYIAVKSRWDLDVDSAEKNALTGALAECSSYAVAKSSRPAISTLIQPVTPKPKPRPVSVGSGGSSGGGGSAYYRNCDAARAAGAAPVEVGDPGYGRHLDRDGDGIGCE